MNVARLCTFPERKLTAEGLALALRQKRILPMAKAATLAQMSRWDFEQLLSQRHIERPYLPKLASNSEVATVAVPILPTTNPAA